jgi:hypothetical protein
MPSKADALLSTYSKGQILDAQTLKELRELRALERRVKPIETPPPPQGRVSFAAKAVIVGTPSGSTQNDSDDRPISPGHEGDSPKAGSHTGEAAHADNAHRPQAVADGDIYVPGHSPRSTSSISATLTTAALRRGQTGNGILSRVRKLSSSAYSLARSLWRTDTGLSRVQGRARFGSDSLRPARRSQESMGSIGGGFIFLGRRRLTSRDSDILSEISLSNKGRSSSPCIISWHIDAENMFFSKFQLDPAVHAHSHTGENALCSMHARSQIVSFSSSCMHDIPLIRLGRQAGRHSCFYYTSK